jgi:glycerophosphoryl diester phosphodiesterase
MKFLITILFFGMHLVSTAQIPFFQAHRGGRGLFPENTLIAFEKSLNLGMQVMELDVCISADGQVVVSHEPYMNPLFASLPDGNPLSKEESKKWNLFQMPYAEIQKFDVGKRGNALFPAQQKIPQNKPLLSQVLTLVEAFRKRTGKAIYYNIEIKSDEKEYGISQPKTVEEFSQKVADIIQAQVDSRYIILQSFDFQVLKFWHKSIVEKRFPPVLLSALVSRKSPENTIKELGFSPDIFSSSFSSVNAQVVQYCHEMQIKVVPWTVNELDDMQKLMDLNVDGIITDYPDRALTLSKP